MKKNNKKGFTLAELLIVVAIIAVLTAIAIPVFKGQLDKAKYASDEANARSIYAEMVADYLANGANGQSAKFKLNDGTAEVKITKGTKGDITVTEADGTQNKYPFNAMTGITFTPGSATVAPKVVVDACDFNENKAVTFGVTTMASGS